MLDLKFFRENTEKVRTEVSKKKFECDIDAVLELDGKRRQIIQEAETKRAEQKSANGEMAKLKKGSPEFLEKVKEMKLLAAEVKALQSKQTEIEAEWKAAFLAIPNLPDPSVPVGETEDDNQVFFTWGDPKDASASAIAHWDIPWFAQGVDLERGIKIAGGGWPLFVGDVARFVRSLIQFFLDENTKAGFLEMAPPICVNAESATATGQLPDKEGQMYYVEGDELYLIPTAEVPVTNAFRGDIFDEAELPLHACAYTPCFRREAGSHGKDVRGLNRVHQFDKVELVKWVHPEKSLEELESMREHVQSMLEKLGLAYRTLLMCSADIGFTHSKQYDLEVFAAGQERWLEVSSCSSFTDFQARRANIRYRDADGRLQFVHTLNGSGLAVPRVLAALLENNYQEDGSVLVPDILQPYFGGDRLGPVVNKPRK